MTKNFYQIKNYLNKYKYGKYKIVIFSQINIKINLLPESLCILKQPMRLLFWINGLKNYRYLLTVLFFKKPKRHLYLF